MKNHSRTYHISQEDEGPILQTINELMMKDMKKIRLL